MITRNNLQDVINSLTEKEKNRILNSDKEFTVLYLHIFNTGYCVTTRLTNDYNRYKNVSNNGDAILYTDVFLFIKTKEVQDLITI